MDPQITLEQYEKLQPICSVVHDNVTVLYHTPTMITKWRVDSLFQKEPSTIQWIAGFQAGDVLIDVGANVGMYTVWAAKTRGVKVFAFEPEAQNYALLNRNIRLNRLEGQVVAYSAALSDTSGFSQLHLSELHVGGSCHSLGEQMDFRHEPMIPAYSQGCVSSTIDELVAQHIIPMPNHIKIDVDGFEPKVIAGAAKVIRQPAVRSLLIEINQNLADHQALIQQLVGLGFSYDPAQAASVERKSGPFKGCAEYVFKR